MAFGVTPAPSSIPGASTLKQHKTSPYGEPRQETRQGNDLGATLLQRNRVRKRTLLALEQVDPGGAAPGLAICRGLDAGYAGDLDRLASCACKAWRRPRPKSSPGITAPI